VTLLQLLKAFDVVRAMQRVSGIPMKEDQSVRRMRGIPRTLPADDISARVAPRVTAQRARLVYHLRFGLMGGEIKELPLI
jgi:hypothetical protein